MEPTSSTDLALGGPAAAQLSYHVRMSAVFAVGGDHEESASESVLAWAILSTAWPGAEAAARDGAAELIGEDQAGLSPESREQARSKALALAMTLEAHYVTTGQHDVASLYERVAEQLAATIESLVAH